MPSSAAAWRLRSGPGTSERKRPDSIGRVVSVTSTTDAPSSDSSLTSLMSMRRSIGSPDGARALIAEVAHVLVSERFQLRDGVIQFESCAAQLLRLPLCIGLEIRPIDAAVQA